MKYILLMIIVAVAVAGEAEWRYLHPRPATLVDAVEQGDARQIAAVVNQSTDLNALGRCGRTPLQMAAWSGDMASLRLLLEHGAGPNVPDEHGYTPLCCAATRGDTQVMQTLLRSGADVNWRDQSGRTPLADAIACMGTLETVQFLLSHGADPNTVASDGWTPLHQAAVRGDVKLVDLLLKAGARTDVRNGNGHTALAEARRGRSWDVVRLLSPRTPGAGRRHHRFARGHAAQAAQIITHN